MTESIAESQAWDGVERRQIDVGPPEGVTEARVIDIRTGAPYDPFTKEEDNNVDVDMTDHSLSSGALSILEVARTEAKPEVNSNFDCFATDDPDLVDDARRMTAKYYLARGFITTDMLDDKGRIAEEHDEYLSHSTYYVFRNRETGDIVASCRKIRYDPEKGEKSFPIFEHKEDLNPELVESVEALGLENVVEISTLVKDPTLDEDGRAVFKLYRKLFQDSWNTTHSDREEAFIMACNPKLYKRLKFAFDGIIHRFGKDLDYPGQVAVPAVFFSRQGTIDYIRKSNNKLNPRSRLYRRVVGFMFQGVDPETLEPDLYNALVMNGHEAVTRQNQEDTSSITKSSEKISRKPEIIAAAGLLGYTALRTEAVRRGLQPHTNVDWRVFLGVEVATTWPYAKGMGTLVRSIVSPDLFSKSEKTSAAIVAGSSLLAPYAYIMYEGEGMGAGATAGVAGFVAVSVGSVVAKIRGARRARAEESSAPPMPRY